MFAFGACTFRKKVVTTLEQRNQISRRGDYYGARFHDGKLARPLHTSGSRHLDESRTKAEDRTQLSTRLANWPRPRSYQWERALG